MQTNTNNASANERNQPSNTNNTRRDDDRFWTDWWREYAQTWK